MDVMDGFPIGTTGGGDFLTGLPAREFTVVNRDGNKEARFERVVMTDKTFQFGDPPPPPGRVGFSELSIMKLAMAIGMVPESTLEAVHGMLARMTQERDELSRQLVAVLRENEALREQTDVKVVYVAADGTEFASRMALTEHQYATRERPMEKKGASA
jgi:hypothetical protein